MNQRSSHESERGRALLPRSETALGVLGEIRHEPYFKWKWVIIPFVVISLPALGYFAGLRSATMTNRGRYGLPSPPGPIHTKWEHNLTFTQKPTQESEAAWASIIPIGRGFVHHKKLAPFISNIAVFHQLHCLHAIVIAYYDALESEPLLNVTNVPDFEEKTSTRIAPVHIRHCFDYIRQALMCAADTNLEALNQKTHLTNGWGQPKQCRDYQSIFAWAEKFANSSDIGIIT